ncbi:heat-inducible transcription repressor HrcA [Eggerthellaceae bacterium zg-887]|uniref:heat-inducible transcriptional repressor HrcA n=1 Tax=Xiamenia xianingshaonis TaxID=2682776 RepID=UPI00140BC3C1|nr:heat-inducible transcriptional repressor HrcA [Xiamenia xianingshaonis]NHM15659.1 heat-inducible transcription repressor HrcA [Xiamenia xianingshaonis]
MLSDRRQRVLAALIEEYVARAMPVGSRTLTERYSLGVSPATVRNELSVLEDGGYIVQPHTSAGRIPTDFGYRAFVDRLLATDEGLPEDMRYKKTIADLRQSATELDDLLEETSSALARLTNCLSIVLAPSIEKLSIKSLSIVSLTPRRALVLLVTEDGQVFSRSMDFSDDVDPDELARIQLLLSEVFTGKSLTDIERGLDARMIEAYRDPLMRIVLNEVLMCLEESEGSHAHRLGVTSLLRQPEFSQADTLLPIMQVLEDDSVLLRVLQDTAACGAGSTSVRIGSENEAQGLSGVSVVANTYGRGNSAGIIAVIGPTRMDYSNVIHAVAMAKAALDDV